MKRFSLLAVAVFASLVPTRAAIILDTVDGGQYFETRPPESAILSYITVGGSNVAISGFGTYGQMTADGQTKWLIFDGTSHSLLYQSAAVAQTAANGPMWYDSPAFAFTLQAGQSYFMGLMANVAFSYGWEYPGYSAVTTPESANGLTAPLGTNGNASGFASPAWTGGGGVQQSIRIMSGEVPEPGTAMMLVLGLGALAAGRYRRRA